MAATDCGGECAVHADGDEYAASRPGRRARATLALRVLPNFTTAMLRRVRRRPRLRISPRGRLRRAM